MSDKYPLVLYEGRLWDQEDPFGPKVWTRVELGTAFFSKEYPNATYLELNDSPWAAQIRRNLNAFQAGLCQGSKDAPVEMILSPKRAYPAR